MRVMLINRKDKPTNKGKMGGKERTSVMGKNRIVGVERASRKRSREKEVAQQVVEVVVRAPRARGVPERMNLTLAVVVVLRRVI